LHTAIIAKPLSQSFGDLPFSKTLYFDQASSQYAYYNFEHVGRWRDVWRVGQNVTQ